MQSFDCMGSLVPLIPTLFKGQLYVILVRKNFLNLCIDIHIHIYTHIHKHIHKYLIYNSEQ